MHFLNAGLILGAIVAVVSTGAPVQASPVGPVGNDLVELEARATCTTPPSGGGTTDTPYYICGTFDGNGATYDTKTDWSSNCDGESGSNGAVFIIADGGTVKNVVIGGKQREGIHCKGSCTVSNVTFKNVCEDVLTAEGSGTATFQSITTYGGSDKVIQHDGSGNVVLKDITVYDHKGKIYRSCGDCTSYTGNRKVSASNVVASGGKVSMIMGIKEGDYATWSGLSGATACYVLKKDGTKIKECSQGQN